MPRCSYSPDLGSGKRNKSQHKSAFLLFIACKFVSCWCNLNAARYYRQIELKARPLTLAVGYADGCKRAGGVFGAGVGYYQRRYKVSCLRKQLNREFLIAHIGKHLTEWTDDEVEKMISFLFWRDVKWFTSSVVFVLSILILIWLI